MAVWLIQQLLMRTAVKLEKVIVVEKKADLSVPYPPSWQNRFFDAVHRLPVPSLLVYILIYLGVIILNHLIPWLEGKLPWGKIDGTQFINSIWLLVALIAFDYFISLSKTSVAKFRPALEVDDQEYKQMSYRLATLSAHSGWFITIATFLITFGIVPQIASIPLYLQSGFTRFVYLFSSALEVSFTFSFYWFLYHALRTISQLYTRLGAMNLFHLEPLYGLAGFTSRAGIFFVINTTMIYLLNIVFTETPQLATSVLFGSISTVLALASFILPLGRLHARVQTEKERVSHENNQNLKKAYLELQDRINQKNTTGMADFRSGLLALLDLRQEIKKIPTWPWDSATLRGFITALFVPLAVWLIQQVLIRTVK